MSFSNRWNDEKTELIFTLDISNNSSKREKNHFLLPIKIFQKGWKLKIKIIFLGYGPWNIDIYNRKIMISIQSINGSFTDEIETIGVI